MKKTAAIVLAAGKGTRMKSALPKMLHEVAGRPMLYHTVRLLKNLKVAKTIVVIGHGARLIREAFALERITFVEQTRQFGTGHAVMKAAAALKGFKGDVLILSGDAPLIKKATIKALYKVRGTGSKKAVIALVTAMLRDPAGYGRVVRDSDNAVARVVEHKDCNPLERTINEVNTGHYLVDAGFLLKNILRLGKQNAQHEYYLPDLVHMAVDQGLSVKALTHMDAQEVMGVNDRVQLAMANCLMRLRIVRELMHSGVTVLDPGTAYIDTAVKVGRDTIIHPSVHLAGTTVIGANCVIEEGVKIIDSVIGKNTAIKSHSIIEASRVGLAVSIGPFARLRPGNRIGDKARIGNFVELKNSVVGALTKAGHLSYLGDSVIGRGVNIGAGTITCNYDGRKKYVTRISDGAFIGSDTQLIAPVKVGKNAYVASGTTVTRDVPAGALVLSRAEELVKKGWAKKRLKKK